MSQLCHGSSAVMACAKLWHDLIIISHIRAACIFTGFGLWALKHIMTEVPGPSVAVWATSLSPLYKWPVYRANTGNQHWLIWANKAVIWPAIDMYSWGCLVVKQGPSIWTVKSSAQPCKQLLSFQKHDFQICWFCWCNENARVLQLTYDMESDNDGL